MKIHLIRHAKTKANEEGRYVGILDSHLSEAGRKHAKSLTPFRGIEKVYASPLSRARETASILFPDSRIIIDKDLAEMDFGHFEGRNFKDLKHDPKYIEWVDNGGLDACPGGEEPEDFNKRIMDAIRRIIDESRENDEEAVHIVTHGGVIMSVLYELTGKSRELFDYMSKNCGGWSFEIDGDEASGYRSFDNTDMINESK